ncbi:uracil-DNA glycosylase, putative [Trypanosoma equiperdum]|uniref:Uracil-DNA glycosylase n=4 Tax=Trypanozoon TaxID=39700 RepID=Q388K2_TRYB2|nr:uracil-DNA glycosylase, putative [Trypanosoma brucei brucei TREU927]EAN78768.1 uracil-DNA glycosylase, putative [Trypanosoma brucei brucei TREU927]SCU65996.1 uracil-DNA glycosylase, putative [Trypanosoma equiperdum]
MVQRTLFDFVSKKGDNATTEEVGSKTESGQPSASSRKRTAEDQVANGGASNLTRARVAKENNGALASLIVDPGWEAFLKPLTTSSNFERIEKFLEGELNAGKTILPPREMIFSAFNSTPLDMLKVVLLGQDPYHNVGQAHGLCFSVLPGVPPPPSLINMYKELATDIPGFVAPQHGYLQHWAEQGVLMLNATLTVEIHKANSHATCGWQTFTDDVIRLLSEKHKNPLVFLLWGGFAKRKISLIDRKRHVVIECAHPSPLSAAKWWGSRPFSKCNTALVEKKLSPIDWKLPVCLSKGK